MRLRVQWVCGQERKWYEYLMQHQRKGNEYGFPQMFKSSASEVPEIAVRHILDTLKERRGMIHPPDDPADLEKCLQFKTLHGNTEFRVYFVPFAATQRPRRDRALRAPPNMYWVAESELAAHDEAGPPRVFGARVAERAQAAVYSLPTHLRFASPEPPLVLYHGTSRAGAAAAASRGLLPSQRGMVGAGVYLARWDKAADFARADADGKSRDPPGQVLRCLAWTGRTVRMAGDMVCTCGCGQPFVDHHNEHGRGFDTTYVADDSLPATRRAEWCVRNADRVACEGLFDV